MDAKEVEEAMKRSNKVSFLMGQNQAYISIGDMLFAAARDCPQLQNHQFLDIIQKVQKEAVKNQADTVTALRMQIPFKKDDPPATTPA